MEKGSFALLQKQHHVDGEFIRDLDPEISKGILAHGIRNSHLTSIAPTGTISLCADNVSSGIEPVFSHGYTRTVQTFNGPIEVDVKDYAVQKFGVFGKTSDQVTIDEHLAVLLTAAKNVDSAVSKTCNVGDAVSFEDFKQLYVRAYEGGAKGCTTFRASGKRMGIFKVEEKKEAVEQPETLACTYDPETGIRSCE
jgi:ribonucleoside-diphosphate reductase alpha chain